MNQILRFSLVLLIACGMPSCVVDVDPAVNSWEGPAGSVVVGSATTGMVGYHGGYYRRPSYSAGYYGRPYYRAGYHGRSYARGYWRPYAGGRPGRF